MVIKTTGFFTIIFFLILIFLFIGLCRAADKSTIAVLRFENKSQTDRLDLLETGLPQMIISDLVIVSSINVVERERVEALLQEVNISESALMDKITTQKAGKALGADYLLKGTFNEKIISGKPMDESILTISVQVFDVNKNKSVKNIVTQGTSGEFFKLEKDIVQKVISELKILVTDKEKEKVEQIETRSLEAQIHYLRGWNSPDDEQTIKEFKQAIYLDPNFELVYYRLADRYGLMNNRKEKLLIYEELVKRFPQSKYMVDYLCGVAFTSFYIPQTGNRCNEKLYYQKAIWAMRKRLEEYPDQDFLLPSQSIIIGIPPSYEGMELDNTLTGCARMLRECYHRIGDADKAKEVHEKWLGMHSFYDMVRDYTNEKDYDKLIELYQKRIDENKAGELFITYKTLYKIGEIYCDKLKNNKKAIKFFRKALAYLPRGKTAFRNEGECRWPHAGQIFERMANCFDNDSAERIDLCSEAIKFYLKRNAPEEEKENVINGSFYKMIDTYYKRKDIDGAVKAYKKIKKLLANKDIACLSRGEKWLERWLIKTGRAKKDKRWINYRPQEETDFFAGPYWPTSVVAGKNNVYYGLGRGHEIHDPHQRKPRVFSGCVLGRYLKTDDKWELIPIHRENFYNFVISQMLLIDKEIWLACYPRGIARYNVSSETWSFITTRDGLPSSSVHCLASIDGDVWVGFGDMNEDDRRADKPGGIIKIDRTGNIIPYLDAKGTEYPVTSLAADGNLLWVGTSNGTISQFDIETQKWKIMKKVSGEIRQIAVGRDDVWFACIWNGLYRYNRVADRWHHYKHEDKEWKEDNDFSPVQDNPYLDVTNCVSVSGNELWVSVNGKFYIFDITSNKWILKKDELHKIYDIAVDTEDVWIGSWPPWPPRDKFLSGIKRYRKFPSSLSSNQNNK